MSIYYINGEFVPAERALIPAHDLSVLRGYGVFDFLRTYNGRPFRLMRNIQRLRRSADLIELEYPWSDQEIHDIVMDTLARNDHPESNIRILITGGISPDNIFPSGEPGLIVMVTAIQRLPDWWYSEGVKVLTVDIQRLIPNAKSTNYIPAIMALKRARAAGAVEAIYQDAQGMISEGTTTNIFAFFGDTLVTPSDGILPGLTRATVLELAQPHHHIEQRAFSLEELLQADEVFICAANKQVVPVRQINDTAIGDGQIGPRTRQIMTLFHAETQKIAEELA